MRRRSVNRHLNMIEKLRGGLRARGTELSRRLAERSATPAGESFSHEPMFDLWDAQLADVELQLAEAEDAYVLDKHRVVELRRLRDEAGAELHGEQTRFHRLLRVALDTDVLAMFGIGGAVPQGGYRQVRRAEITAQVVHDLAGGCRWPLAGVGFEPGTVAELLEAGARKLSAALRSVEGARQDRILSHERADKAVAEADRVVPGIARLLESLCALVGEERLVRRMRGR